MRKSRLTIICFLVSLTAAWTLPAGAETRQSLDGNWIGRMHLRNGPINLNINHELKMKIRQTWPRLIIEEAENEHGKLFVTEAWLRFSDVHSPLEFDVEMYEFVQDHYYHFTLTGNVVNDNLIQGDAVQTFDDSPHFTNDGEFILVRDQ
ncbi:MAG: hypothetical protein AAB309_03605 [Deltaproteobacteria bacterium]